jgi:hypothetical protein
MFRLLSRCSSRLVSADYSVSPALRQIYDYYGKHTRKGSLALHTNGAGLLSNLLPTGIVSLRERHMDVAS